MLVKKRIETSNGIYGYEGAGSEPSGTKKDSTVRCIDPVTFEEYDVNDCVSGNTTCVSFPC